MQDEQPSEIAKQLRKLVTKRVRIENRAFTHGNPCQPSYTFIGILDEEDVDDYLITVNSGNDKASLGITPEHVSTVDGYTIYLKY